MEMITKENACVLAPLFDGWNETMIWSYLHGCMGNGWADQTSDPESARIITGDFCFLAGKPDAEFVKHIPSDFPSPQILMVPRDNGWSRLIERCYPYSYRKFLRYALKKEPDAFDTDKLAGYVATLTKGYRIHPIDEAYFHAVRKEEWSKDLCSQFSSYEQYRDHGMGYLVLHGDKIVSGVSSYTYYDGGIEIEIDTRKPYRKKGLALACAAHMILECLKRGLYPSWDAANKESLHLAEKLGYHLDSAYVTYGINLSLSSASDQ
ncbi:GNAT family N-acetyltransferase [Anaerolentibacter hominis]|uniref:GNAT family N-acetyltransferase n=1 Tax=Anaerolentibacter hominis TaxID=3079009 RepID=UPI0031B83E05